MRIGVPKEFFCDYLHPEVASLFYDFIEILSSTGNMVVYDLDLHNTERYCKSWQDIRLAEAAQIHLKWLDTRADDHSHEVRQMLVRGTRISAVDYINSIRTVKEIRNEFLAVFSDRKLNAFVVPTTIIPAPRFDEETVSVGKNVVLETRQALLRNTIVFNSTGLPTINIPIGLTKDKMPIGAQIIGPPFKEEMVLSIAYSYECMNNSWINSHLTLLQSIKKIIDISLPL